MQTLFDITHDDDPIKPSQEEELGWAMSARYQADMELVRKQGRIGDWQGEPVPLSKDKYRLLKLLYEVGAVTWRSQPCQNNRDVTKAMGLNNTGNAKAVLDSAHREGLITSRLYRGEQIMELAAEGEYALEEYELEVELGLISL